jgi:regulator of sigma E protease
MSVALMILQVVLIMGLLIFFHEAGHFLASRAVGIPVEEFGFGYPPRLAKIGEWKGTEITLNWIPFGGFVHIHGEGDETVEDGMAVAPPWKRLIILFAGPVMNFIIGVIILVVIYSAMGVPASDQALVNQVAEGSPALTAGFEVGDTVVSVDEVQIESIDHLIEVVNARVGQEIAVVVDREGETVSLNLIPRVNPPAGEGAMGISLTNPLKPMPFFQSVGYAFQSTGLIIKETILLPGRLISGAVDPALARPIGYKGIYDVYTWAVEQDTESTITTAEPLPVNTLAIIANISISLGIANLLPIPALDGGRILFTLPELIFKKRIPQNWQNAVNTVCFMLLIGLMVFVTILDFTNPVVLP